MTEKYRLVQTSAVLLLPNSPSHPIERPATPPSPPLSPPDAVFCEALEHLEIDDGGDGHDDNVDDSASLTPRRLSVSSLSSIPESSQTSLAEERLRNGLHVLNTEANSLAMLAKLYESDATARDGFSRTVAIAVQVAHQGGKLVLTGVGKSGHIARKLAATFSSVGIQAVFMHATEAVHGDLGIVGRNDAVLCISYSGETQELLSLVPHLDALVPLILLTSHTHTRDCSFFTLRPDSVLLPAPAYENERVSFGVSAPTTSTTMAIAIGDAVALTAAQELHSPRRNRATVAMLDTFARNHPGGAIGASFCQPTTLGDLAVDWASLAPPSPLSNATCTGGDLLRAAYGSASGWVRIGSTRERGSEGVASPSQIRNLDTAALGKCIDDIEGLVTMRADMLDMAADTDLRRAGEFLRNMQIDSSRTEAETSALVIAVVHRGEMVGVLEAEQVLSWSA